MDPQLSGKTPRGTRQAQQKRRKNPVHHRAFAAVQECAGEVIKGALAALLFTTVAFQTRLGVVRALRADVEALTAGTLDLLQKSLGSLQVQVVETRQQVQAQAESSPSVSIFLTKDSEHLQFPYNVLTDDSPARQDPILLLLLLGQFSAAWLLLWGLAIAVPLLEPLRAFVCQTLDLCRYGDLASPEQFTIVLPSLADGDTDDLAGLVRDDELGFLSVARFLPAVGAPLFF